MKSSLPARLPPALATSLPTFARFPQASSSHANTSSWQNHSVKEIKTKITLNPSFLPQPCSRNKFSLPLFFLPDLWRNWGISFYRSSLRKLFVKVTRERFRVIIHQSSHPHLASPFSLIFGISLMGRRDGWCVVSWLLKWRWTSSSSSSSWPSQQQSPPQQVRTVIRPVRLAFHIHWNMQKENVLFMKRKILFCCLLLLGDGIPWFDLMWTLTFCWRKRLHDGFLCSLLSKSRFPCILYTTSISISYSNSNNLWNVFRSSSRRTYRRAFE